MEDLLASIRKAINEDIGAEPAAGRAEAAAPRGGAAQPQPEQSASASEIQLLREKISRSRGGEPPAPRDPAQRAASLAAALRSETPRRAWRDLDAQAQPQQLPPRLRASIIESDAPRVPPRSEQPARTAPRFTLDREPAVLPAEDAGMSGPRDGERAARADQPAILSGAPAQAVQSAFGRLADTVLARAIGEQSIEEMTRELLKGMLKQWLDDNLPQLVERLVREEIERVARTGR
jgi:cell pole-organizing protein PopZ